jgi:hypothetical protein
MWYKKKSGNLDLQEEIEWDREITEVLVDKVYAEKITILKIMWQP